MPAPDQAAAGLTVPISTSLYTYNDRNQDTQLDRVASERQQTKIKAQRFYYIHNKKKSLQSGHSL